jgi:hypothetical protein
VIKGQLTEDDFIGFQRLHAKQPPLRVWIAIAVFVLCMVMMLKVLLFDSPDALSLVYIFTLMVVLAVVLPVLWFVVLPWRWRKVFRQIAELKEPFGMELKEEEIVVTSELSTSRRPWKNFRKWKEDSKMILLYHADNLATMLPKRFFQPEEIDFLYRMIQVHKIPKNQWSTRKSLTVGCAAAAALVLCMLGYLLLGYYSMPK